MLLAENVWQAVRDWLLTSGLRIAFILVVSLIASRWLRVLRARLERLIAGTAPTEDEAQRARTLGGVIQSTTLVTMAIIAGLMILRELGLDIAPLIAGGVEKMTLRATFLRDLEGTLHVIPNGEMRIVSNRTKDWSRAVVNVGVAYEEDIGRVVAALGEIGHDLYQDEVCAPLLLEEPTVSGVEALGDWAVTVRIMVKTMPGKQWDVARELRRRIKESFEREGIEMPYPRQEVLMRPLPG